VPEPEPKWFVGTTSNKLDSKGRVFLPVKMRPLLSGTLYLTRHPDGCLRLYTEKAFTQQAERQEGMLDGTRDDRNMVRRRGPATEACMLDPQGRITIPAYLRAHAKLEPEGPVVVAGVIGCVELWNEEQFALLEDEPAP
jgi:MraZ protein